MLSHALRTLIRMVLTFFVIVTIVFFATRLSGNAVDFVIGEGMTTEDRDLLIRYYELDRPIWSQYLAFLRAFTDGQFGLSFIERRPVSEMVLERVWPSSQLLLSAVGLTVLVSIPLGIAAAIWRKSWVGQIGDGVGVAAPDRARGRAHTGWQRHAARGAAAGVVGVERPADASRPRQPRLDGLSGTDDGAQPGDAVG